MYTDCIAMVTCFDDVAKRLVSLQFKLVASRDMYVG